MSKKIFTYGIGKKKLRDTTLCTCGFHIPIIPLDLSPYLVDSFTGVASCSNCGAGFWLFSGSPEERAIFDQVLPMLEESLPEIRQRLEERLEANSSRV